MNELKPGDIIFVRGHSFLADEIRHYDPGEFSHVCIAVSSSEIFEARGGTLSHETKFKYKDYEVISTNLSEIEIGRLVTLCKMLRWKPYDYIQDLGYVFHDLFGIPVERFNDRDALICSEAIALVLYLLGKLDQPMPNITPNQLFKLANTRFVNVDETEPK